MSSSTFTFGAAILRLHSRSHGSTVSFRRKFSDVKPATPALLSSSSTVRSALPRLYSRANSTATAPRRGFPGGPFVSHILAGIAGGSIVIGAGYAYYHFSGIKQAVETAKNVNMYLQQTKASVMQRHPNEAVEYLRKVAKTYGALVPGSGLMIDRMFNAIEEVVEEHREEASEIMLRAQIEIQEVMKRKELTNAELASSVMNVVGVHLAAIGALGSRAGGKFVPDMTYPREKIAESAEALKVLGRRIWPGSDKREDESKDQDSR
ncbi:hypothetical protein V5O48_000193 [Marasmius crinis-equi]|uniref:Uncharacterized protein n=1 Tax=Marasmius crinis-equi TaxID=585013 RepID=A0ABR3G1V1_9AGAR